MPLFQWYKNLQMENIFLYLYKINELVPKEFENYKIFNKEKKVKEVNEVWYSICLLSKNIKLMKRFFSEYLYVILFEEDDYDLIDLENPIASTLFISIFNDIYNAIKNEQRANIKTIIEKCLDDTNISLNKFV